MSTSRILLGDSSRNDVRDCHESVTLGNEHFRGNPAIGSNHESENSKETIEIAEAIERKNAKSIDSGKGDAKTRVNKRDYAQSLHRQADLLQNQGDYEMALVMYNRAASACPRDSCHAIAARRTGALISSLTNPSKSLRKILPGAQNVAQLVDMSCPETAARRAQKIVEESADPISAIDEILKYFDSRKDLYRDPTIARDRRRSKLVSRSRTMLRQLGSMASLALENLQVAFASGDFAASLQIGNELLAIAEPLVDRYRYEVAARHYLAMSHVSLGRHDRAVDQVTRMIESAKKSANSSLRSRSFMTLGRVHLTFRHLDAAARAWERLAVDVDDAVPKAWLLHEIGRCYFELKRYGEALKTSRRCLQYAAKGKSQKWLLHGQLLSGQALAELGRLGEAVIALKKVRTMADNQKDVETRDYVSELVDRIVHTLRRDVPSDQVLDEGGRNDENFADKNNIIRVKSEDVTKSEESKGLESSMQKSGNLVTLSRLRSKLSKSRGRMIKSSKNILGRRHSRTMTNKTRRKLLIKIAKSSILSSTSNDGSDMSDDHIVQADDVAPSDDSDEAQDEVLTSRTRVIEKRRSGSEIFIEELLILNKHSIDNEQSSADGETSNRSGRTYVLDEPL